MRPKANGIHRYGGEKTTCENYLERLNSSVSPHICTTKKASIVQVSQPLLVSQKEKCRSSLPFPAPTNRTVRYVLARLDYPADLPTPFRLIRRILRIKPLEFNMTQARRGILEKNNVFVEESCLPEAHVLLPRDVFVRA